MKKLSEIGTHCKPDSNSLTQFEEHLILTREERRELVREAIFVFIMDHVDSYLAKDSLGNCVERLFKEQGL